MPTHLFKSAFKILNTWLKLKENRIIFAMYSDLQGNIPWAETTGLKESPE